MMKNRLPFTSYHLPYVLRDPLSIVNGKRLMYGKQKIVNKKRLSSAGFTLVELSISTVIFSLVLMLCVVGLLQISRTFYKGLTASRTQEAARNIIDGVSRQIQFGGQLPFNPPTGCPPASNWICTGPGPNDHVAGFCIGDQIYSYAIDAEVSDDSSDAGGGNLTTTRRLPHAMWRETDNFNVSCNPRDLRQSIPSSLGEELLGVNMRLSRFAVSQVADNTYQIDVWVVYGDTDLLDSTHQTCQAGVSAGGQFCAVSQLSTVVTRRLR